MKTMTNYSGKFVPGVSHATSDALGQVGKVDAPAEEEVLDIETDDYVPVIPPVPEAPMCGCDNSLMGKVRGLFGKLWWLWIVVVVLLLAKED